MRVLVTGHQGYIGSVLMPLFRSAGHDVVGLDTFYFEGCDFGANSEPVACIRKDLRDVTAADVDGFDAIVHLAALSNDPVGNLNPACTYAINQDASIKLAQLAKDVGVRRFLFSSSCSLYGAAGDEMLTEEARFNPVTPYGESKIAVERELSKLAGDNFSPSYLRNATAYGASPRLRMDLMVNDLVAHAYLDGEVLIKSDGTPWRPLVHVEDIAAAFLAVLQSPREAVYNQAFNVGRSEENFRVREVAEMVRQAVPGSKVVYAEGGGPDLRCYRVSCDKLPSMVPDFQPRWTVRAGIDQLHRAYAASGLTRDELLGSRYVRLEQLRRLMQRGELDAHLQWAGSRSH